MEERKPFKSTIFNYGSWHLGFQACLMKLLTEVVLTIWNGMLGEAVSPKSFSSPWYSQLSNLWRMTNSEKVWALHENGVIKTIPTENLESICFKSAFLYCVLRPISWFIPNHIRNLTSNTLGSGIPLVVSWSPFPKQFQNHCQMSMAIMIEWRVLKIWVFWCCGKLILPVIIAKSPVHILWMFC